HINAIKLDRTVEMYQWQEHVDTKNEKQVGGSEKETKTFTYKKVWSAQLIDSTDFKVAEHHQNPKYMPLRSSTQYAKTVTLGDFLLPEELIKQINLARNVNLSATNKETLQSKYSKPVFVIGDQLFLGQDVQNPVLGDLRIGLTAVYPQTVSIIAQQTNHTLQAYSAPPGESLLLLSPGEVSSDQMIHDALSENTMWTWLFRLASLIMLIAGFALIFKPLVILADVIPFIGSIIGFGTGFLAMILGLGLWILFIAIAWCSTRPLLSIGLTLIILIGGCVLLMLRSKKNNSNDLVPKS
ncbi:MAG: TMEM43 family protein, partial [bacterium]|nr:TMEM43 family protein [bacterium]